MEKFKLHIMASDHTAYDGDAESVVLPTTEGQYGVLAHHENLIMAVVPGPLTYKCEAVKQDLVVSDGLLKIENGEVLILVDTAEKPEDIDVARARRAEQKAREKLKRANSQRDHVLVEAELSRAVSRLKASRSIHKF